MVNQAQYIGKKRREIWIVCSDGGAASCEGYSEKCKSEIRNDILQNMSPPYSIKQPYIPLL